MATVTKLGSNQATGGTTLSVSPSQQVNVGDFIVVLVAERDQAFSGVADNSSQAGSANTYTQNVSGTTTDAFVACYSCRVTRNILTSDAITVTLATGGGSFVICVLLLSDVAASSPFDTSSVRRYASTTSPWTSNATATTAQADEVLVGISNQVSLAGNGTDGGTGPDAPWTQEYFINQASSTIVFSSRIVAAAATYAHSGVSDATGTGAQYSLIATYKLTGAAAAAAVPPSRHRKRSYHKLLVR
jgi:hypothetical protein